MGEPGVDPVPCLCLGLAVVGGGGDRGDRGLRPGVRLAEVEFRAVLRRPAALRVVDTRRLRQSHDTVGTDPADQLDGQVAQGP